MGHFEREAKINVALLIAIPAIGLIIGLVGSCILSDGREFPVKSMGGEHLPITRD